MSSSMRDLDPAFQGAGQKAYSFLSLNCLHFIKLLSPIRHVLQSFWYIWSYWDVRFDSVDMLCCRACCYFLTIHSGIEIWRIENFKPVLVPKSSHGKFFTGDSYIILKVSGESVEIYCHFISTVKAGYRSMRKHVWLISEIIKNDFLVYADNNTKEWCITTWYSLLAR